MEKNGMLTENSYSDTDTAKKAAFVEKDGFTVADAANKDKLKQAQELKKMSLVNSGPLGMFGSGDF